MSVINGTTSGQHRRLSLLSAHLQASAACVLLSQQSPTSYTKSWGLDAAKRIGRLWGPAPAGEDFWGLETRQLLDKMSAAAVATVGGAALFAQEKAPHKYP